MSPTKEINCHYT